MVVMNEHEAMIKQISGILLYLIDHPGVRFDRKKVPHHVWVDLADLLTAHQERYLSSFGTIMGACMEHIMVS